MALTVDTIRNFGGVGNITLDQQKTGIEESKLQGFKSFFNIGDARQKNAETLLAIHHAILNDPRYFSQSVQSEAARLLSQVRTDRAIGAAQIQSIIARLDEMSTPGTRRAAAMDVVSGHLAARGFPDFLSPCGEQGYAKLAREHVASKNEPAGGYGRMNFKAGLDAFEATMRNLFARLGDGAGDGEVLSSICGKAMRAVDGGLKPQDSLEELVDKLKANLDESRALGTEYGEQTRLDVVELLKDMEKPIAPTTNAPNPIRALAEAGRSVPVTGLANLGAGSSAEEINDALRSLVHSLTNVQTGVEIRDGGEVQAAQMFMVKCAVNSLSDEAKAGLLAALESDTGKNLLALYAAEGANREASNVSMTVSVIVKQMRTALGRPDADQPLQIPDAPDATKLSPRLLAQFSLLPTVSGTGAGAIQSKLDKINMTDVTELAKRKTKMADMCHAMIVTNIASQVGAGLYVDVKDESGKVVGRKFDPDKIGTQFDLDIVRDTPVRLPNGQFLTQDPAVARDELVRFVTGDDKATFAAADTAVKMKVHILASCLNQSVHGGALDAFGESINDDPTIVGSQMGALSNTSLDRDEVYALSKEENGDFKIHFFSHRPIKALSVMGNLQMLGSGSFDEYEVNITFPAANLDALSRADWTQYDHAPVNAADKSHTDTSRHTTAANLVPDAFKFTGTVTMAPHLHLVEA